MYHVQIDYGDIEQIKASSLAALANLIRGRAKNSVIVWADAGTTLVLIDVNRGFTQDTYGLLI